MKKSMLRAMLLCGFALVVGVSAAAGATTTPTPAALAFASRVIVDIGLRASLDGVVPNLLTELELHVTQSRPETKDAIHEVVFSLAAEFGKTEQGVLDAMAASLASHMSEQDLGASVTFLDGPAGKSFVAAQIYLLQDMGAAAQAWREKLAVDMFARAREEMKKKGFDL